MLELINRRVVEHPKHIAIEQGSVQINYEKLDEQSNNVASYLKSLNISDNTIIAVYSNRSIILPSIAIGIMKASNIYLPIDASYPHKRLNSIIEDSQATIVINNTDTDLSQVSAEVINAKELFHSFTNIHCIAKIEPSSMAYLIYTSGSTGVPKGVMIQHGGLTNLVIEQSNLFQINTRSRVLQFASPSFDASISEIFVTLSSGATLVIPERMEELSGIGLNNFLLNKAITCVTLPPSIATSLPNKNFPKLNTLVFAGERLSHHHIEKFNHIDRLLNAYGPTEATVCVSIKNLKETNEPNNIGKAIHNMRLYLADDKTEGEIIISGIGLSAGYLNQPKFNQQAFFEVYEKNQLLPIGRYYRTGDLGRRLANGEIVILGRIDEQIKWHGIRIEPAEIEQKILINHKIAECRVTVLNINHQNMLIACIVAKGCISELELNHVREDLLQEFPRQMCPQKYIIVDELPLTINGKLDKNKLIVVSAKKRSKKTDIVNVQNSNLESKLIQIWKELFSRNDIDTEMNFYDLGGHSLLETNFVFMLQDQINVYLPIQKIFELRTIKQLSAYIEKEHPDSIIFNKNKTQLIKDQVNLYQPFPLTDVQQAYLLGRNSMFDMGATSVHVYFEFELEMFDIDQFEEALNILIARQSALRIIFTRDGMQKILENVPRYKVKVHKTSKKHIRKKYSHQIYNPEIWPLFSFNITQQPNRYCLHFDFDALIIDGLSLEIFFHELNALYCNTKLELVPLDISFRDYVVYYDTLKNSKSYQVCKDYWYKRLTELSAAPVLPLLSNSKSKKTTFIRLSKKIPKMIWINLQNRLRQLKVTKTSFIIGVYAIVLKKWTGSDNFLINLTIFNRLPVHDKINQIIGDFSTLLLLHIKLDNDDDFTKMLHKIQKQLQNDLDHKLYSGVEVLRDLRRIHKNILAPIVITSFLHEILDSEQTLNRGMFNQPNFGITQSSQVWLDFKVYESEQELILEWDYLADFFSENVIESMHEAMINLIMKFAEESEHWLEPVTLEIPDYQVTLRKLINNTTVDFNLMRLEQLFFQAYKKYPNNTAVITHQRILTYKELYQATINIAWELQINHDKSTKHIVIFMSKGWEQVVACLGILTANYAYLPIDPSLPTAMSNELLNISKAKVILTRQIDLKKLAQVDYIIKSESVNIIVITESVFAKTSERSSIFLHNGNNLAYTIFTSGSTGKPKGVMMDHFAVVNTIMAINQCFSINPKDRVFALSRLNFDLSVYDIFGPLATGAALCIPNEEDYKEPKKWQDYLDKFEITIWNSVPALMQMLLENIASNHLRLALLSGDKIPVELPEKIFSCMPNLELISLGGATEAAIWSIYYPIKSQMKFTGSIPYGKPLPNQYFYVLDENLKDCPDFVMGNIYIAGAGLAVGYYNNIELTDKQFFIHPQKNIRIYKTGDLGRYLADGNIEIMGRNDGQIKIGGHRIELGEIEVKAVASNIIPQAIAVKITQQLYLFVVCNEGYFNKIKNELHNYLVEHLPSYMVPNQIISIHNYPLTNNGKIDYNYLAKLINHEPSSSEKVTINDKFTRKIADIWQRYLNVEINYNDDDFFLLGGDSLSATRAINEVNGKLNLNLLISSIFENSKLQTFISYLKQHIETDKHRQSNNVYKSIGAIPLSHGQMRLYFINQLQTNDCSYHLQEIFNIIGNLRTDLLQDAIKKIVDRHEVLRTLINLGDKQTLQQKILQTSNVALKIGELGNRHILDIAKQEFTEPFNLNVGPLVRFALVKGNQQAFLIITLHHIIADAWSLSLLYREIADYYNSDYYGKVYNLASLPYQYKDYALWQQEFLVSNQAKSQIEYWKSYLENPPQCINLPKDMPYPIRPTYQGNKVEQIIPKKTQQSIERFCLKNQITPYMLLISIYALTLNQYTNDNDIIIGSPIAGRSKDIWQPLIGFFINTLPMRFNINKTEPILNFINRVKKNILNNFNNQSIPLDIIIEHTKIHRDNRYNSLFQVIFDYQRRIHPEQHLQLVHCITKTVEQSFNFAQFDLSLDVIEDDNQCLLKFIYNTDIFHSRTIEQILHSYLYLLDQILNNPDCRIGSLNILNQENKNRYQALLTGPKITMVTKPICKMLCKHNQNDNAVIFHDQKFSYGDLYQAHEDLIYFLNQHKFQSNCITGLLLEKSPALISLIYSLWCDKHCISLIDSQQPWQRTLAIIDNLKFDYLITEQNINTKTRDYKFVSVFNMYNQKLYLYIRKNKQSDYNYENYAYVLHTSGTTGIPKAIKITFNELQAKLAAWKQVYNLQKNMVHFQLAQPHFDVFIGDFVRAMCTGASLLLIDTSTKLDLNLLYEQIKRHNVSFAEFVPQHLKLLCRYLSSIDEKLSISSLIIGSDKLIENDIIEIQKSCTKEVKLFNSYGTTETCIDNILYRIDSTPAMDHENHIVSIGIPLPGEKVIVVNDEKQLLPPGVCGELAIQQHGQDEFYFTGDYVKYNHKGELFFSNRNDHVIKIRGLRINVAEIEFQIKKSVFIDQSFVIKSKGPNGEECLVAYLYPIPPDKRELIQHIDNQLRVMLPDYMIPKQYLFIDQVPLNNNGKIDIQSLPDPHWEPLTVDYDEKLNPTQKLLKEIWINVLGRNILSIDENYFSLGGDSITSIAMISTAREKDLIFDIQSLFNNPTIRMLATIIQPITKPGKIDASFAIEGEFELTQAQNIFFKQDHTNIHHYNQSIEVSIKHSVKFNDFATCFTKLVENYDIFRIRFKQDQSGELWKQYYLPSNKIENFSLTYKLNNWSKTKNSCLAPIMLVDDSLELKTSIIQHYQQQLDIYHGPLFIVIAFCKNKWLKQLYFIAHHLIVDIMTWQMLVSDLNDVLHKYLNKQPIIIKPVVPLKYWLEQIQPNLRKNVSNHNKTHLTFEYDNQPMQFDVVEECLFDFTNYCFQEVVTNLHCQPEEFFVIATVLALTTMMQKNKISFYIEKNGRDIGTQKLDGYRCAGWLTQWINLQIELGENLSTIEQFKIIKESIRNSITNTITTNEIVMPIVFNYLGRISSKLQQADSYFSITSKKLPLQYDLNNKNNEYLSINLEIINKQLEGYFIFNPNKHSQQIITCFIGHLKNAIKTFVNIGINNVFTPSDFPLVQLSQQELDELIE